jgi:hypothetical protein
VPTRSATPSDIAVLAPEDEQELAEHGWASEVCTHRRSALERLTSPAEAVREPLAALLRDIGVERGPRVWATSAGMVRAVFKRVSSSCYGRVKERGPCSAL